MLHHHRSRPARRRVLASADSLEPRRLLSAGDPDPTFGDAGRVVREAAGGAFDVAVQNDDKIVVVGRGRTVNNAGPLGVVVDRLNPDGSPDLTFGQGGRVVADFGAFPRTAALAVQPDGKIVVAAAFDNPTSEVVSVARLLPTGAPDASFGPGGRTFVNSLFQATVHDLALAPDGKIVVVGGHENASRISDSFVVRLTAAGVLDNTFSGDGVVLESVGNDDHHAGVAVDPSGRVVTSTLAHTPFAGSDDLFVSRYTAAGALDTTFGTAGRARYASAAFAAGGVALDRSGSILVALTRDFPQKNAVLRYTAAGQLDRSFGSNGLAEAGDYFADFSKPPTLAIQNDGDIVIAGTTFRDTTGPTSRSAVARLKPGGTYDTTFGDGGTSVIPNGLAGIEGEWGAGLAVGLDGGIILAGRFGDIENGEISVVRVDPGDVPAPIRLSNGVLTLNGTDAADAVTIEHGAMFRSVRVTLNGLSREYADGVVNEMRINTHGGNDTLTMAGGLFGPKYFSGGAGTDTAILDGNDTVDFVSIANAAVPGFNALQGGIYLAFRETEAVTLRGRGGNDRIDVQHFSRFTFDDPVTAFTLDGGDGNDTLVGGPGVDSFLGGNGDDTILARDGNAETVNGGSGTDSAGTDASDSRTSIERLLNSSIEGLVFADVDRDGTRDPAEVELPGFTVYVDLDNDSEHDAAEPSAMSLPSGTPGQPNFLIENLAAGTYTVRTTHHRMVAFAATSPSSGSRTITLAAGQRATGANFGYREVSPAGTIRGTLFNDHDSDGAFDSGELSIAGRTVYLDADNDGALDAGELSTTTSATGGWEFRNLPGAFYTVRQVLPSGWRQTLPAPGNGISLKLSEAGILDRNSLASTNRGGISGLVFEDIDGNGTQGASELGLSNHSVYLDLDNSGTYGAGDRITTTDFYGRYYYGNLDGGTYAVRLLTRVNENWVQTAPAGGAGRTVNLGAGQQAADVDFGAAVAADVRGYVFNDRDADGYREPWFETGVGGTVVFLDADNDGDLDPGELSDNAEADGFYWFRQVVPGDYRLRVVVPAGWSATTPASQPVSLTSRRMMTWDFGLLAAPGVAGRRVFYNNSSFDGWNRAGDFRDDAAVATDKVALRPGQRATFANYTSYSRGLNGVMVDLMSLRNEPTLADFSFRVAVPGSSPTTWTTAPTPTMNWRPGGPGNADRVVFVWPDGAINNTWLQVTVLPTATTRLTSADVFYFGNLVGDTGDAPVSGRATVNVLDLMRARAANLGARPSQVTNRYDFNRDGRVNAIDVVLLRMIRRSPVLQLITAPA